MQDSVSNKNLKKLIDKIFKITLKKVRIPPDLSLKEKKEFKQGYKKGVQEACRKFLASLQSRKSYLEGGVFFSKEIIRSNSPERC